MVCQQELLLRLLMGQAPYWRWYSDHIRCTAVHTTTTTKWFETGELVHFFSSTFPLPQLFFPFLRVEEKIESRKRIVEEELRKGRGIVEEQNSYKLLSISLELEKKTEHLPRCLMSTSPFE
ncbi:hypothetical protein BpHYR1_000690 [Brachionus plicatilis]|uniref:Uncharacterized protein n=1 Tax=Brachionus plicatilis TaxID=10195 RepID=A0A3M7T645_BRAPC|nr:hypothetical protein BpHYR1_000690 [Brachionus plicatilis]